MFHGSLADRIALTEILLSPGGEKLSREAAQICAVLILAMPDPEIQTPSEFQFYRQQAGVRAQREFDRESLPGLRKSLSKAHDNLAKQVGINTRLYSELSQAKKALGWQTIWIRVLVGAMATAFTLLGWIMKTVLEHFAR